MEDLGVPPLVRGRVLTGSLSFRPLLSLRTKPSSPLTLPPICPLHIYSPINFMTTTKTLKRHPNPTPQLATDYPFPHWLLATPHKKTIAAHQFLAGGAFSRRKNVTQV